MTAYKKVLIGRTLTKGLGAGGDPAMGAKAAEVDRNLLEAVFNRHTACVPVLRYGRRNRYRRNISRSPDSKGAGRNSGCMVTYPFDLERVRKVKAEEGIQQAKEVLRQRNNP